MVDRAFLQNNNSTFSGFSEENLMSIDTRGFKVLVQGEAETFLRLEQLLLNSTVTTVRYSANGVEVALSDGRALTADYAICTFRCVATRFLGPPPRLRFRQSLGVLQHDDVQFYPPFPEWKREAIFSMNMVRNWANIVIWVAHVARSRAYIRNCSFNSLTNSGSIPR